MDKQAIRAFVEENRQIANQQLARWDAVDPSRLLEALSIIEALLDSGAAAGAANTGDPLVFDDVLLTRFTNAPPPLGPYPIEFELAFLAGRQSTLPYGLQLRALLNGHHYQKFARIEVYPK
jgi:hypothetical protein